MASVVAAALHMARLHLHHPLSHCLVETGPTGIIIAIILEAPHLLVADLILVITDILVESMLHVAK